jgi:hypothetical protein
MNYVLGFLILIFNILICFKKYEEGLVLYIILSLISPNIHFLNNIISYEIWAFIPIFLLFILHFKKISTNYIHILFYMYIILLLTSSLISINLYSSQINWIAFLGNVRIVLIFFMLTQIINKSKVSFEKILLTVICVNFVLCIIQITFSQTAPLFYNLYYKPSMTPLSQVVKAGRFYRAYGSFGTPVNLGGFSLIAFSYFYAKLLDTNYNKLTIYGLCASIVCGLLSLTKTYIVGMPIIICIGLIFKLIFCGDSIMNINIKKLFKGIIIFLVLSFIGFLVIEKGKQIGMPFNWYLSFIIRPFDALVTRYDLNTGILSNTMEVIRGNILIGVGNTKIMNEFIGDSGYTSLLHSVGMVGTIFIMFIYCSLFLEQFKKKKLSGVLIIIAILFCGVAFPVFTGLLGMIVIWHTSEVISSQNNILTES